MRARTVLALSTVVIGVLSAGCSGGQGGGAASSAPASSSGSTTASPSATSSGNAQPAQAGAPWHDDVRPEPSAGKIGGSDTPCALPVAFDLAKSWKAQSVQVDASGPAVQLGRKGGFGLKCEIDAKGAGHLGFLRVWVADQPGGVPRQALEKFLGGEKNLSEQQYRELTVGGMTAAEVTYAQEYPAMEMRTRKRVVAVNAPRGMVLVALDGLDADENRGMVPAHALAKQSMTPVS
ncbi:lipoprotein [Streptoalloteichus hindustanus]|uniref:DUF3558 domain-containing protein n=1 Tax=Streptoalloteichus hindustanus TaxID=2017 RepID=A0A1M5KFM7_STRHI|nr:lipoprotein [Streptoalloteichus hindustanus]SHG51548.1 hypothetical protein SAMN05444320_109257 [Streptoalloteichus hindustanus]